jgi:DNA polymerase III subunit delta'
MTETNNVLIWQQKYWDLLCRYSKQKRLPQALLITGAKGLGKHQLANQFAHALLCSNPQATGFNCGLCDACLLIKADTHPDLIYIKPEEEKTTISIKQIRQLVTDANLKPQFEGYRVAIINPADVMTPSASNAFLKCLEEPNERTLFVLITDKPSKLPATIISRCQKLALTLPERELMLDWLNGQGIHDSQETLLNLVGRSILTAQQITDDTLLKQRTDCFNDWMAIAKHKGYPAIISVKWQKLPETVLLNWLISWITDLIKCAAGSDHEQLCNRDMTSPTQELAQRLNLKGFYGLYDQLLSSRRLLTTQVNFQVMIEEILVQWQVINGRT